MQEKHIRAAQRQLNFPAQQGSPSPAQRQRLQNREDQQTLVRLSFINCKQREVMAEANGNASECCCCV